MLTKEEFIKKVQGNLIVSCQAVPGEPLYRPEGGVMPLMAKAAMEAGAAGIRSSSIRDVTDIMAVVPLPMIGIIKKKYPGYDAYITPTMDEVDALVATGCDVIALDCTPMSRPGNLTAPEFIRQIKEKYPQQMLMADCSSLEDARLAAEAGIDFVGTTMNGYVPGQVPTEGPNFELARQIVDQVPVPLIGEGRIHYPEQAREMLALGALAVVVGGAITRPLEITKRFLVAIQA